MAGRGPAPRPGSRRFYQREIDVVVAKDGKRRGPTLPRFTPLKGADGAPVPWHPQTRKWWDSWRRSPQALRMQSEPDWAYLLETAVIHHQFWMGRMDLAGELRLREAKFGPTPADRAMLRVEIADGNAAAVQDSAEPAGNVASIEDRRRRLTERAALDDDAMRRVLDEGERS